MANKPPVVCRALGCSNATTNRYGYCDDCLDHARRKRSKRRGDPFYWSTRWKKFRAWYIGKNPLCEMCKAKGVIAQADVIDHIVEISDGGAKLSEDNVQSLCNRCHAHKTADAKRARAGVVKAAPAVPMVSPWK